MTVTPRRSARRSRARPVVAAALACLTLALVTVAAPIAPASAAPARDDRDSAPWPPARRSTDTPVFVLDDGRFTTYDGPGRGGAVKFQRINNRGEIVGAYRIGEEAGPLHGYRRDRRGRIREIAVPGAAATIPSDINDHGTIVGNFQVDGGVADGVTTEFPPTTGFLRDERGRVRSIRVPGATATQAIAINNRGHVVGDYQDRDGVIHGYRWDGRRFTTVDGPVGTGATLTGINDRGEIVGVYQDPDDGPGTVDGFLLSRGRYTTIDDGDAVATLPLGINNRGRIVGQTADNLEGTVNTRGFVLRRGADGPFTRIDFPGAPLTAAYDINDHGQIVGAYLNPDAPLP
jgi:hypothetical protein